MTKSKGILGPRKPWTPHELKLLRDHYPDFTGESVAALIGRPVRSIYMKANQLGIFKSEAFKSSDASGLIRRGQQAPAMIDSRFKKGLVPWNKGMKGVSHGGQATQFVKGRKPHTCLPVGTYRIGSDGNLEQKVTDLPGAPHLRWHTVHRIVWEAANGPVPKGHMCVFKHGTHTTKLDEITLDRIECISRAENLRRNHPRSKHPELGRLVQLKAVINRHVNRITREAAEARKGEPT